MTTQNLAKIGEKLPHFARGEIVKGFGRGSRDLGFPTANFPQQVIDELPEELVGGIYFGFAQVDDGPVHDMVMSIGWNPFYNNEKRAMETHIIHKFDGDLYGKTLSAILVGFLRPEANFESLEKLIEEINSDIENGLKLNKLAENVIYRSDKFFKSQNSLSMDEIDTDENPLAFLGLKRVGTEYNESPTKSENSIELNRRGIPARKRKKNSLIYGSDDLVSIPVKSPKKKVISTPTKLNSKETPKKGRLTPGYEDTFDDDSDFEKELDSCSNENDYSEVEKSKPVTATPSKSKKLGEKSKQELYEDMSLTNRLNAQRLGVALRNLLKLPKAHKWVCFEFFYSNIDRVLFCGENDFLGCLKESFPQLKTRRLSRVEWCKVRRLMGKPRRCSEAFFNEERAELARKRKKMRFLQQRKIGDASSYKDLPEDIPMQLTIGCRVTARLRQPQDGLFTGVVAAVDTSNSTYRITFDRLGLGTHSIPDFEVLSTDPPDLMPLSSFLNKSRSRPALSYHSPPNYSSSFSPQLTGDPLLSGSTPKGKSLRLDGTLGGYPVKFLYHIVKLNKSLLAKKEKVRNLREMNTDAEKVKSFGEFITEDFQRRYAGTVMEVYKVNEELNSQLREVSQFTAQFSAEAGPRLSLPEHIRENCKDESYEMVTKLNSGEDAGLNAQCVQSPKLLGLVASLSALMLQVKRVADGERNAGELQAIKESLVDIEAGLSEENVKVFQDNIMVHMQHIQQGLSQMGNLTAFMTSNGD